MSTKLTKKWLGMFLSLSMIIAMLAACSSNSNNGANNGASGNNATPTPTPSASTEQAVDYGDTGGLTLPLVDEPTEITWMLVSEFDIKDSLVVKEIEKRTGIKVNFQAYSPAQYQDKLSVVLASGDLPDIFHGLTPAELKEIGGDGAVVAINDYADMLPNFSKLYLEENPWVISSYGNEEGKLFAWPIYKMNRDVNHGFMYRKDIFEANGIEPWTDTEGFYQALKKLKEIYPDSTPYASKTNEVIFSDWAYGWGIGSGDYPLYYNESTGKWEFASTTSAHKDQIDFMKKLYNEGLLDPEFITDTSDSWTAKMTNDKAFVTWDWIGRLELFYNQVKDVNPNYDLRYANPVGPTGNIRSLPIIDAGWGITVANNDKSEIALKLLDYLTSPSGAELITVGAEGINFEWDANGKPVYPELEGQLVDIKVLEEKYGMWVEGSYLRPDRRSVYYNFTEKEQEAQDMMLSAGKFEALDPVLNFTDAETAKVADLKTRLSTMAEEFNTKYVMDKNYGEAQWEQWVKDADKNGATELVEIYNAAQARYDASK